MDSGDFPKRKSKVPNLFCDPKKLCFFEKLTNVRNNYSARKHIVKGVSEFLIHKSTWQFVFLAHNNVNIKKRLMP